MSGNKNISVLFINHWAGRLGGAEYSLLELLSVVKDKFNCCLVTSENGPLVDKVEDMGITTQVIGCDKNIIKITRKKTILSIFSNLPSLLSFIRYSFKVSKFVKRYSPVLVHANVPKAHTCLSIVAMLGYKGISCFHIREIFSKNEMFSIILYKLMFPFKNTCVIAISRAVKESLNRRMKNNCKVIYNGISIPEEIKKYSVRAKCLRLVYLGRVVPWKGCGLLLEIMEELNSKGLEKEVSLSIVGDTIYWDEGYRQHLENRISKSSLRNNCSLLGHNEDVYSVFREHDVFCNASHLEPFGRSVAEAQGAGLPVVAFDTGGINEIVSDKETGFLISYGDIGSFSDAIVRFLKEPELIKKMGVKGRESVKKYFNVQVQGRKFISCVNESISRVR